MTDLSKKLQSALDSDCASSVEDILKEKKATTFKALNAMLKDGKENNQRLTRAIYLLGRWQDTTSIETIIKVAPKLDEVGKITALDALSHLGSAKAMNAIMTYATDPSPNVRKFAVRSLRRFDTKKATDLLKKISKVDDSDFVRETAKRVLSQN